MGNKTRMVSFRMHWKKTIFYSNTSDSGKNKPYITFLIFFSQKLLAEMLCQICAISTPLAFHKLPDLMPKPRTLYFQDSLSEGNSEEKSPGLWSIAIAHVEI